ncbi:MAG: hypothetical protein LLG04_19080 [Parachlamydia sp.]|nr:hypothetical protein [Parachlamydia sp.]
MDLNRVVKAFDPIHMNEKLFEATDQLEKSRYSTAARRMVEKFSEFELCLATAALGVAAVARQVFVAIAGSALVLVKMTLHVIRALTKSRPFEKAYKQLPGKQSCINQTKRIFGQTLGIGASLIGAALFWSKAVKWDISTQIRLGNYHPNKPVTKPKPAIQPKPNVLKNQQIEPTPGLLPQPANATHIPNAPRPPAPPVPPRTASLAQPPAVPPRGQVAAQSTQPAPAVPPRGQVPAPSAPQSPPAVPPRGQVPAPSTPQPPPAVPPRSQLAAPATPQPVPKPLPRTPVPPLVMSPVVAPPPLPRAQESANSQPVVAAPPPPPPRAQAALAQPQDSDNPPVAPVGAPPPPPPPPPSGVVSPRNKPAAAVVPAAAAPAAQQTAPVVVPAAAASSTTPVADHGEGILSPRSQLAASIEARSKSLNQGTAAKVEAERKADEEAKKAALKKGTMRTNTKLNISAHIQGTAPKPAAAPSRPPLLDPKPNAAQGGWILDFEQNLYDFETTYEVEIYKQGEENGPDIIKLVDYIRKHLPSPQPGNKISLKSGGELEILPPNNDGVPLAWFKHPDFPAAS